MLNIVVVAAVFAVPHASVPPTMRAVKALALFGCKAPDFSCLDVVTVSTPKPKHGLLGRVLGPEVLIKVNASSVNPSDVDLVETPAARLLGILGDDVSGVVVACPDCKRLKVGDAVWGAGGFAGGAMAEYVVLPESGLALKPSNLDLTAAGTIPAVGLSSLFSLKATGAPWTKKNLTVVVTSGSGGTGFIGIQLAKVYGAAHVVTAASPANFAFVKSLGADTVIDYHQQDIFDFLPENSVDIVYDNFGKDGTADKAMHAIRPGGTYLILPHGECFLKSLVHSQSPPCTAKKPKEGVSQVNFDFIQDIANRTKALLAMNEMKDLFEDGKLTAHVEHTYTLDEIRAAYARSASGHIVGKIAITPSIERVGPVVV